MRIVGERGDRDRLAPIEANHRSVDDIVDVHDHFSGQGTKIIAGPLPDFGARSAGQDRLDKDTTVFELDCERLAEIEDKGLGAAIYAVHDLRNQRQN